MHCLLCQKQLAQPLTFKTLLPFQQTAHNYICTTCAIKKELKPLLEEKLNTCIQNYMCQFDVEIAHKIGYLLYELMWKTMKHTLFLTQCALSPLTQNQTLTQTNGYFYYEALFDESAEILFRLPLQAYSLQKCRLMRLKLLPDKLNKRYQTIVILTINGIPSSTLHMLQKRFSTSQCVVLNLITYIKN